jgi:hypothetical protein
MIRKPGYLEPGRPFRLRLAKASARLHAEEELQCGIDLFSSG